MRHNVDNNGIECFDMLRQNPGVKFALDRLSGIEVVGHLNSCILTRDRGENQGERKREDLLSKITDI